MAQIYTSGTSFDTATTVSGWKEFPFRNQGDASTVVYHHIMRQSANSYQPPNDNTVMTTASEKPARSPFSDDSNAYYAGDYNVSHIGDNLIEFNRQFAHVPQQRTIDNGLYAFTFGDNNSTPGNFTLNKNFSISGAIGTWEISFTVDSSEVYYFDITSRVIANAASYFQYGFRGGGSDSFKYLDTSVKSVTPNGPNFDIVCEVNHADAITSLTKSGTEKIEVPLAYARTSAVTSNVASIRRFRYLKRDHDDFVPLSSAFLPISTSSRWKQQSELRTDTLPTPDMYVGITAGKGYIRAESDQLRQWKNNIYEIESILVRAE